MDNDAVSGRDYPLLRRRNSISTPNIKVAPAIINLLSDKNSSATTSSSSDDLELLSVKPASHSYTSLKDLLPSTAVNSPRPNSAPLVQIGSDISIRNHLVKQAAWAYLQPMSTTPGGAGDGLFHDLWPRVSALFDFVRRGVVRILDWALRFIRIRSSR